MTQFGANKIKHPLVRLHVLSPTATSTPSDFLFSPDNNSVRCLNESAPGGGLNCLKPWDRRRDPQPRLESEEDDPELIIFVPFTQVRGAKCAQERHYCMLGVCRGLCWGLQSPCGGVCLPSKYHVILYPFKF